MLFVIEHHCGHKMIDILFLTVLVVEKRELLPAWNQPPLSASKDMLETFLELDVYSVSWKDLAWGLKSAKLTDLVGTETMILVLSK